jgi:hypothetical protein
VRSSGGSGEADHYHDRYGVDRYAQVNGGGANKRTSWFKKFGF